WFKKSIRGVSVVEYRTGLERSPPSSPPIFRHAAPKPTAAGPPKRKPRSGYARREAVFLYVLFAAARWSRLPRPSKIERFSNLSGARTGSSEVASRRMRISTLDISGITTTVRRHEALLR